MGNGLITLSGNGARLLQRPEIRPRYLERRQGGGIAHEEADVPTQRGRNGLLWGEIYCKITDDFPTKSARMERFSNPASWMGLTVAIYREELIMKNH